MNSAQRRKRRRRLGIRPPYQCFWCQQSLPAWDSPCACVLRPGTVPKPRKLLSVMTISELAGAAWDRGLLLDFRIVPRGPDINETLAAGEPVDAGGWHLEMADDGSVVASRLPTKED